VRDIFLEEPLRIWTPDSPWEYNDRRETRKDNPEKKSKFGIGVQRRYSAGTMTQGILFGQVGPRVQALAADQSMMISWATGPRLQPGLDIFPAWGFEYKTIGFVWEKIYRISQQSFKGPGRYTFSNVELGLLGMRGRPWNTIYGYKPDQVVESVYDLQWEEVAQEHGFDPRLTWDAVVRAKHPTDLLGKIIHSRKPPEFLDRISRWFPDEPKIELFATEDRSDPNWLCLGHEISGLCIQAELADLHLRRQNREVLGL
jgi:N6-adenosine-specific RNA methylase IME4